MITTALVPCPQCGMDRPIKGRPWTLRLAASRTCRRCGRLRAHESSECDVDEIAVVRLVSGTPPAFTTRAERQEAVRILIAKRLSNRVIAGRLHVTKRTVERLRSRIQDRSAT